jgi:hypothetical protein
VLVTPLFINLFMPMTDANTLYLQPSVLLNDSRDIVRIRSRNVMAADIGNAYPVSSATSGLATPIAKYGN